MTQQQKQIVIGGGAVILLITGIVYWFWRPANNANMPNGTWWICTNNACKNEFSLTMSQLSDHHEKHYGQPVHCPKCDSVAIKADKCPSCGKVFVMQRNNNRCPACGKPTSTLEPESSRAPTLRDGDVAIGLADVELLVVARDPANLPLDGASKPLKIAQFSNHSVSLQPLH
jgi:rRNA maturation protein Nop10